MTKQIILPELNPQNLANFCQILEENFEDTLEYFAFLRPHFDSLLEYIAENDFFATLAQAENMEETEKYHELQTITNLVWNIASKIEDNDPDKIRKLILIYNFCMTTINNPHGFGMLAGLEGFHKCLGKLTFLTNFIDSIGKLIPPTDERKATAKIVADIIKEEKWTKLSRLGDKCLKISGTKESQ